jgi:hypothetical protein
MRGAIRLQNGSSRPEVMNMHLESVGLPDTTDLLSAHYCHVSEHKARDGSGSEKADVEINK